MVKDRVPKAKPEAVARPEPMPLDDYRELVQRVMQDAMSGTSHTARVFQNSGAEHARVVLETMLENAHESVNIHSHELGVAVWDADWFRSLVTRAPNVSVRIVLSSDADTASDKSALCSLQDLVSSESICVRRSPSDKNSFHMTIVDGQHVRLEKDHASKKAVVAFGAKDVGEIAGKAFSSLWKASAKI